MILDMNLGEIVYEGEFTTNSQTQLNNLAFNNIEVH